MSRTLAEALEGYVVTGAGVIDRETIGFSAHVEDEAGPDGFFSEIVSYNLAASHASFIKMTGTFVGRIEGGVSATSKKTGLFVSHLSDVVALNYNDGPNGREGEVPFEVFPSAPKDLRFIGKRFYVAGDRVVARRLEPGKWEAVLPPDPEEDSDADLPWIEGIDGFSETDIYVGGTGGLLKHFDGRSWTDIDTGFKGGGHSEDYWCSALQCADGKIYAAGRYGELIVGREGSGWTTLIPQQDRNVGQIRRLAWYDGRLYASTEKAFLVYDGGTNWQFAASLHDEAPADAAFVDATAGLLLVAGPFSITLFDGKTWAPLWGSPVSTDDRVRLKVLEDQEDAMEDLYDAAELLGRAQREGD